MISHAGSFMLVTGKQRASLSCAVGSLVVWNIYVARNPAEFDPFASIDEICIVFEQNTHH